MSESMMEKARRRLGSSSGGGARASRGGSASSQDILASAGTSKNPRKGSEGVNSSAEIEPDEVLEQYGSQVYSEDFDPVRSILEEMPAEPQEMGYYMMTQQERTDIARDAIQSRLNKAIMNNYNELIGGMKHIQDIDLDISKASVQIVNTLRKVKLVKDTFAQVGIRIAARRRRRERLVQIKEKLQWLHSLTTAQSDIAEACCNYNFTDAMKKLHQSQKRLQDTALRKYSVLGDIRSRLLSENAWPELRKQIDSSLLFLVKEWSQNDPLPGKQDHVLQGFGGTHEEQGTELLNLSEFSRRFSNIVRGYNELDRITDRVSGEEAVQQINQLKHATDIRDDSVWAQWQENSIKVSQLETLAHKIHNCVVSSIASTTKEALISVILEARGVTEGACRALYEKSNVLSCEEGKEVNTDALEEYVNEDARLKQLRFPELCTELAQCISQKLTDDTPSTHSLKFSSSRRSHKRDYENVKTSGTTSTVETSCNELSAEGTLVHAFSRIVAAITSVLHSHYLMLQMLRTPLDSRNSSWEYVHRCGVEEHDSVQGKTSNSKEEQKLVSALKELRTASLASREDIWMAAQSQVGTLLLSIIGSCGNDAPEAGVTRCLAIAFDFMHVGAEYIGITAVPKNENDENEEGVKPWKLWKVVASCSKLRDSLHLACSHLVDFTRTQSLSKLRTLLSRDQWVSAPGSAEHHCALLTELGKSYDGLSYTSNTESRHVGSAAGAATVFLAERNRVQAHEEPISAPLPGEAFRSCSLLRYIDYLVCASTAASSEGFLAGRRNESLMMGTLGYELDKDTNSDAWALVPSLNEIRNAKSPEALAEHFGLPAFAQRTAREFQNSDLNHFSNFPSRSSEDDRMREVFASLAILASADSSRFQLGYVFPRWMRGRVFSMYGGWEDVNKKLKHLLSHHLVNAETIVATDVDMSDFALPESNPFGRVQHMKPFLECVLYALQNFDLNEKTLLKVCPFSPESLRAKQTGDSSKVNDNNARVEEKNADKEADVSRFSSSSSESDLASERESEDEDSVELGDNDIEGVKLDEMYEPSSRSAFCNIVNLLLSPELQRHFDKDGGGSGDIISGQFSLAPSRVVVEGVFESIQQYVELAQCLPGVGIEIWQAVADVIHLYICALATSMVDSSTMTELVETQGVRMERVIDKAVQGRGKSQFNCFDSSDIPKTLLDNIDSVPHFDTATFKTSLRTTAGSVVAASLHAMLLDSEISKGENNRNFPRVSLETAVQMTSSRVFGSKPAAETNGKVGSARFDAVRDLYKFITESRSKELLRSHQYQKFESFVPILNDTGLRELAGLLMEVGSDPSIFPLLTLRDLLLSSIDSLQEHGEKLDGTGTSTQEIGKPVGRSQSKKKQGNRNDVILSPIKSRHGGSKEQSAKEALDSLRESLHTQARNPGHFFKLRRNSSTSVTSGGSRERSSIQTECVAAESLIYALSLVTSAKKWLEMTIPSGGQGNLQGWYNRLVTSVVELRGILLAQAAGSIFSDIDGLPDMVTSKKWNSIRDFSEVEHSEYIKPITSEILQARRYLDAECGKIDVRRPATEGKVPSTSALGIEAILNDRLMLGFIRGVARVPNCTFEGRGLMTMDVDAIYRAMNHLFHRPQQYSIRSKELVVSYIKAYYFDREEDIAQWINDNKYRYPLEAFIGLLNNGPASAEMRKTGSLNKRRDDCKDALMERIAEELNETLDLRP
eukprot:gb/GECG01013911.1/.p1 GENE.gb/GECG01013911.1/~~gb/GECG01013911.1/.p1  ORF type:complete len:1701 (+),score=238.60 gb/GECG01013911.1/:1-5103(+)